jgi:hypothetical protein
LGLLIQSSGSSESNRLKPNNIAENAIRPFVLEFAIYSDVVLIIA